MAYTTPTVEDVAARLPARTKDAYGNEVGDFTADTRPTAAQVTAAIAQAEELTLPRLGVIPDRLDAMASAIVTIRAAMMVELRFWPEQTEGQETTYAQLRQEYQDTLKDYDAAVLGDTASTQRVLSMRQTTFYTSTKFPATF